MGSPTPLSCRHHAPLQPEGALPGVLGQPAGLRDCLRIPPCLSSCRQIHLSHQRDWKPLPGDSGIVCGSLLVCLLAVRYISLISVIGNLSLALVTATMSFRIYKSVLAAVNKNQEGHPFKAFLDVDIRIPEAQLTAAVENAGARINGLLAALKAAILVENLVESAKFAVGMYLVSYLGKLMAGLTLVTLVWAGIFSLPRIYKDNQAKIDEALMPLLTKYEELAGKVSAALPASVTGKKEE